MKCRDRSCLAVMDERMFGFAAELIKQENEERERREREARRARRLGNGGSGTDNGGKVKTDHLPVGSAGQGGDNAADEVAVA